MFSLAIDVASKDAHIMIVDEDDDSNADECKMQPGFFTCLLMMILLSCLL